MNQAIDRAKQHSDNKIADLRKRLSGLVPSDSVVITCGSYARREASEESDLDFFVVLLDSDAEVPPKPEWLDGVKQAIGEIVPAPPAEDDAFSEVESRKGMIRNIGGNSNTNQKITRRMLLMLEGGMAM